MIKNIITCTTLVFIFCMANVVACSVFVTLAPIAERAENPIVWVVCVVIAVSSAVLFCMGAFAVAPKILNRIWR